MKKRFVILTITLFLIALSGCSLTHNTSKTDSTPQEASAPVNNSLKTENLLLLIDMCKCPIEISATGCEAFEGETDIINATDITNGKIVTKAEISWEYTDSFGGNYNVRAINARNARYFIRPTEKQNSNIKLGIMDDLTTLNARFTFAEQVEVQLNSDITVKGLNGEFELMVLATEGESWHLGRAINFISGKTDNISDIVLTKSPEGYALSSTVPLSDVKISGSGASNGKYVEITTKSDESSNCYAISFSEIEDSFKITSK